MTRGYFLRNIIGFYGIASLPLEMVKQYQKVYLLQCFVRGFQYYNGPKIINQINKSGLLEMIREPENEYDPCAIALYFNNQEIGFIPMESNEVLSVLIDTKLLKLQAEITHIEPKASDWERIHVAIYAMTAIESQTKETIEPYTILERPNYYTLKSSHNTYTEIAFENVDKVLDGKQFYKTMVKNSSPKTIENLINDSFQNKNEMETVVNESRIIIQRNKIPRDISIAAIEAKVNNLSIEIDNIFNDDGYIIANVDTLATMPTKIEKFVQITDKQGNLFYEMIFKNELL
jgi:hypothetical protein